MAVLPTTARLGRRARRVLLASTALLAVSAGIAYATIPDGNGVIHGCYSGKTGNLRIIDDAVASCKSSEVGLDWNQAGPQGPPGISGYTRLFEPSTNDSVGTKDVYAWCPLGTKILGGGAALNQPVSGIALYRTQPVFNAVGPDGVQDGWWGSAEEVVATSADWQLNAYAICAGVQ